jgi:hypothetical protein
MANYIASDTDLTAVANAIRAKSGGSSQLAFPAGFVSEIQAIPTGGGSTVPYSIVTGTFTPVSDTAYLTVENTGITTFLCMEAHVDNYSNYLSTDYPKMALSINYQEPKAIVPKGANYQGNLNAVTASGTLDYYTTAVRLDSVSGGTVRFWIPGYIFKAGVPYHYVIVGV